MYTNLKEHYLGLKAIGQPQKHAVLIRAGESCWVRIFPHNSSVAIVPLVKMCWIKAILFPFVQNNHKTLSIPIHMGVQLLKTRNLTARTEMGIWCCSSFPANRPSLTSAHPCTGYHRGIISLPFRHSSGWQERRVKMTHKVMHWIPVYYFLKCVPSKLWRAGPCEKSFLDTDETVWGQNVHSRFQEDISLLYILLFIIC